jgi:P-type E1-E2 ATPase
LTKITRKVKWEELKIGDIVWLKKNEVAPADLLILDLKENYCSVDSSMITGCSNEDIKKPP